VAGFGPLSAHTMTIHSQAARAYAILASVPPERWTSTKDGGLSEQQKQSLVSAIGHLQAESWSEFEALSSVWPSHLPRTSWELRQTFTEIGQKEAIIHFIQPDVTRLGTVTLTEKFDLYWNVGFQVVQGESLKLELRADGHFLKVLEEDGTTTRFDLSSLLALEPSRNIKLSDARAPDWKSDSWVLVWCDL
jgi:hypothetical protein